MPALYLTYRLRLFLMKFLFDLFPVILFFVTFKWVEGHIPAAQSLVEKYLSTFVSGGMSETELAPILLATAVTLVASIVQITSLLVRRKTVDAMLWISFIATHLSNGNPPFYIGAIAVHFYWRNLFSEKILSVLLWRRRSNYQSKCGRI